MPWRKKIKRGTTALPRYGLTPSLTLASCTSGEEGRETTATRRETGEYNPIPTGVAAVEQNKGKGLFMQAEHRTSSRTELESSDPEMEGIDRSEMQKNPL